MKKMLRFATKHFQRLKNTKEIKWRKFSVARVTLISAFAFLIIYFYFWQGILLKNLAPDETPPIKIKMTVSAYYKPLPKQKFYYTGSYWQDIVLNGRGIAYSGKTITIGDAAADLKYYPLGSQFFVPGWGEVKVEDKGSFIKGQYRLDIFVGEGEVGLSNSLNWGKKEMYVEVISSG